jgi:sulfite exporter TauE/SafE
MISVLLTGLIIGLTSNLHCIGMCGPLTLIIPVNRKSKLTIFFGVLIYNTGRILTYSILGLLVGFIGMSLNLFVSIQIISIVLGMMMLLFAWSPYFKELLFIEHFSNKIGLFVSRNFSKLNQNKTSFSPFFFGMLYGLLPCGMVYLGLMNALSTGNLFISVLSMTFFGLGTIPVMLIFAYFMQSINAKYKSNLNKLLPYFITITALLKIASGLNIGITFISPKVKI